MIKALDRFNPIIAAPSAPSPCRPCRGEIRRYFRDFTWTVRWPRDLQERAVRIERERERLPSELGCTPAAQELAERVGCTIEELLDASESGARPRRRLPRPPGRRGPR
jgi:RNA polymerase sigma-B factor